MAAIHTQVVEKATRDRKAAIKKHNEIMHVRSLKFQVGDYVFVAEAQERCFQVAGQVEGPAPRRECGVQLRVRRRESTHKGAHRPRTQHA
jgi:hypothetical protein